MKSEKELSKIFSKRFPFISKDLSIKGDLAKEVTISPYFISRKRANNKIHWNKFGIVDYCVNGDELHLFELKISKGRQSFVSGLTQCMFYKMNAQLFTDKKVIAYFVCDDVSEEVYRFIKTYNIDINIIELKKDRTIYHVRKK